MGKSAKAEKPPGLQEKILTDALVAQCIKEEQDLYEKHAEIEAQIWNNEQNLLINACPHGNALKGYEGLTVINSLAPRRKSGVVKPEERVFSKSSVTGQSQHVQDVAAQQKAKQAAHNTTLAAAAATFAAS